MGTNDHPGLARVFAMALLVAVALGGPAIGSGPLREFFPEGSRILSCIPTFDTKPDLVLLVALLGARELEAAGIGESLEIRGVDFEAKGLEVETLMLSVNFRFAPPAFGLSVPPDELSEIRRMWRTSALPAVVDIRPFESVAVMLLMSPQDAEPNRVSVRGLQYRLAGVPYTVPLDIDLFSVRTMPADDLSVDCGEQYRERAELSSAEDFRR